MSPERPWLVRRRSGGYRLSGGDSRDLSFLLFSSMNVPLQYLNPNYHLPSDTIDTLDFGFMAQLVESLTLAVAALPAAR